MEILKNGSMEKAAEFDEKNDIKVRFECGRCGCEFVASSFAGECIRTSLSMPDVTEKWTAKCPEFGCHHPCYSDDEIIGDDMDLVPPPVEQPKRFRYRGELRYPMANKFDSGVCIKVYEDGRWCYYQASENEVFRYNDNLYVWTGKEWTDFHPGPCTDYDGPKPGWLV